MDSIGLPVVTILYASQTGNAMDVSWHIHDELIDRSINSQVVDIDNISWAFWKLLLRKSLAPDTLSNLKFACFGLGDSSYEKRVCMLGGEPLIELGLGDDQHYLGLYYGLNSWLPQLLDKLADFEVSKIVNLSSAHTDSVSPLSNKKEPHYFIADCSSLPSDSVLLNSTNDQKIEAEATPNQIGYDKWLSGTILENERITSIDHFQDVRSLVIDPDLDCYWQPGDYVSIMPKNTAHDVNEFLELLGYDQHSSNMYYYSKDKVLYDSCNRLTDRIAPLNHQFDPTEAKPTPLPVNSRNNSTGEHNAVPNIASKFTNIKKATLFDLVSEHIDLNSAPRPMFFKRASAFSRDNEQESEKLLEIGSSEGLDLYYSYCLLPKRSIIDILRDFSSLGNKAVPINMFLDLFPSFAAKSYSISSAYFDSDSRHMHTQHLTNSPSKPIDNCAFDNSNLSSRNTESAHGDSNGTTNNKQLIRLTIAIVKYKTKTKAIKFGTCSKYIDSITSHAKINFCIKQGTMKLPPVSVNPVPIIMVGPGTGIAPFISFIEHRAINLNTGSNYLFFGNRYRNMDFLYESKLKQFTELSTNSSQTLREVSDSNTSDHEQTHTSHIDVDENRNKYLTLFTVFSRDMSQLPAPIPQSSNGDSARTTATTTTTTEAAATTKTTTCKYVQHVIAANSAQVAALILNDNAFVYVSGKLGSMPKAVHAAFAECLANSPTFAGPDGPSKAAAYLRDMARSGRYQEECWN
ncbi:NADPH-dependent diflavin oxidoreductase 1 [Smittium culicis]|uniref:NADPH-dependent diflavin oxidoreductase 1 n=1 Tax=Smittium culicis TaxID=133412 RepID=A0A1R1YG28_9FUNG|nr:NADPH-dependent diflavin oxidoreductase 1 [Smittium culicis]